MLTPEAMFVAFLRRQADARLFRIENALRRSAELLCGIERREHLAGARVDTTVIHDRVERLLSEVAELHPVSDAGLAAKGRIAIRYHGLSWPGLAVLDSLARDLNAKVARQRR